MPRALRPKLAHAIFWRVSSDGGLAIGVLAPAEAALPPELFVGGGAVRVDTSYPFGDEVNVSARAFTTPFAVYIRVPGWAGGEGGAAELLVHGSSGPAVIDLRGKNGTLVRVGATPAPLAEGAPPPPPLRATLRLKPAVRVEQWSAGGHSVHRGALQYSLPVAPNFTVIAHHYGAADMSNDYETSPASRWRYALQANPADPAASLTFEHEAAAEEAGAPFNHSGWPVTIRATLRALPGWQIYKNSAAEPPPSPACAPAGAAAAASDASVGGEACGDPQVLRLVPHGSTDLRIGSFPLA